MRPRFIFDNRVQEALCCTQNVERTELRGHISSRGVICVSIFSIAKCVSAEYNLLWRRVCHLVMRSSRSFSLHHILQSWHSTYPQVGFCLVKEILQDEQDYTIEETSETVCLARRGWARRHLRRLLISQRWKLYPHQAIWTRGNMFASRSEGNCKDSWTGSSNRLWSADASSDISRYDKTWFNIWRENFSNPIRKQIHIMNSNCDRKKACSFYEADEENRVYQPAVF